MYINWEDFDYFDGLFKTLDELQKKRYLQLLKIAGTDESGVNITKIKIVHKNTIEEQGLDPKEIITRNMIKKAYVAVIWEKNAI